MNAKRRKRRARAEQYDMLLYRIKMGQRFGYPPCCVMAYASMCASKRTPTDEQDAISKHTGFIPCLRHTYLIESKQTTLEALIVGRDPIFAEFPDDEMKGLG